MSAALPTMGPEVEERRFGGAFAYPGFRWFFGGLLTLSLGVWVSDVAQRWLVQEMTGSPFSVGFISFAGSLPILLFSLPGGVLADRVDRIKLIAWSRGIGAALALLLGVLTALRVVEVWHVALYAFSWGAFVALELPGRQALFPNLVSPRELMHAMAIYSGVWSGSTIVGPAVAGWFIARLGTAGCFYLTAALYALAVWFFWQVRPHVPAGAQMRSQEHPWEAFVGGLRYTRNTTVIFALLILTLLPAVFGQTATMTLLPSFTADVLRGDASVYSMLLTASGIGALLANLGLALKSSLEERGRLLAAVGLTFGAAILAFSLTRSLPLSLAVIGLIGVVNACFMTLASTLVQALVSDEMRGRVMSAYMLTWGMTSFGSLFLGFLGSTIGVPQAIAVGGLLTVLSVALVVARVPELLRIQ
ncbi:MAG: MFS transporter [Chloroflexi bacterium]|nr:MFS transporter [Chloroflexota bacterium]